MSDMRQQTPTTGSTRVPRQRGTEVPAEPTAWAGWVAFGAMMMVALGVFQAIAGFVALFKDQYYVVPTKQLVVQVDYTAWGWVHLAIGAFALAAGIGLLAGASTWARVLGVVVALASALVNFAFLPAYPLWGLIMITLDVLIVYAIIAHGSELKALRD